MLASIAHKPMFHATKFAERSQRRGQRPRRWLGSQTFRNIFADINGGGAEDYLTD
jgi:hypothetical protein